MFLSEMWLKTTHQITQAFEPEPRRSLKDKLDGKTEEEIMKILYPKQHDN